VLFEFVANFAFKISFAGFGYTLKAVFGASNEKLLAVSMFEVAAEFVKRTVSKEIKNDFIVDYHYKY
jgi:hypothetical protein